MNSIDSLTYSPQKKKLSTGSNPAVMEETFMEFDSLVIPEQPAVGSKNDSLIMSEQPAVGSKNDSLIMSEQPAVSSKKDSLIFSEHPTSIRDASLSITEQPPAAICNDSFVISEQTATVSNDSLITAEKPSIDSLILPEKSSVSNIDSLIIPEKLCVNSNSNDSLVIPVKSSIDSNNDSLKLSEQPSVTDNDSSAMLEKQTVDRNCSNTQAETIELDDIITLTAEESSAKFEDDFSLLIVPQKSGSDSSSKPKLSVSAPSAVIGRNIVSSDMDDPNRVILPEPLSPGYATTTVNFIERKSAYAVSSDVANDRGGDIMTDEFHFAGTRSLMDSDSLKFDDLSDLMMSEQPPESLLSLSATGAKSDDQKMDELKLTAAFVDSAIKMSKDNGFITIDPTCKDDPPGAVNGSDITLDLSAEKTNNNGTFKHYNSTESSSDSSESETVDSRLKLTNMLAVNLYEVKAPVKASVSNPVKLSDDSISSDESEPSAPDMSIKSPELSMENMNNDSTAVNPDKTDSNAKKTFETSDIFPGLSAASGQNKGSPAAGQNSSDSEKMSANLTANDSSRLPYDVRRMSVDPFQLAELPVSTDDDSTFWNTGGAG